MKSRYPLFNKKIGTLPAGIKPKPLINRASQKGARCASFYAGNAAGNAAGNVVGLGFEALVLQGFACDVPFA
jgi:hypothetical protein